MSNENKDIVALYEKAIAIIGAMPQDIGHSHEVADDHNPMERDESEIHMALSELKKLAEYSQKLYDKVEHLDGLEGWVASKITKASDYISSAYHWIDYEHGGHDHGCEY